jgi:hypothetical protein
VSVDDFRLDLQRLAHYINSALCVAKVTDDERTLTKRRHITSGRDHHPAGPLSATTASQTGASSGDHAIPFILHPMAPEADRSRSSISRRTTDPFSIRLPG